MSDSRELRLFAGAARDLLSAEAETWLRTHRSLRAAPRRALALRLAHAWTLRIAVLRLLRARGWESAPVTDPAYLAGAWARWRARFPVPEGETLLDEPDDVDTVVLGSVTELWVRSEEAFASEHVPPSPATLGWLHQHFFAERRRATYARLGQARADAAELRDVTQVFTPSWVGDVLLDNSWGRLVPAPRDDAPFRLPSGPGAADAPPVERPWVLDPACGTGLLLGAAFDRAVARGTRPADALADLRGLDVDPVVVSTASLVLTLAAWDALGGPDAPGAADLPAPDVHVVRAITFTRDELRRLPRVGQDADAHAAFWNQWRDADVLGSLVRPDRALFAAADVASVRTALDLLDPDLAVRARRVCTQARWLLTRHDVVVANPPYLGTRHMGERLRSLAAAHYPETKGDLCTMFLERTLELARPDGFAAVVASESWFFTTRTRRVRQLLLARAHLRVAVSLDGAAFGVRVGTVVTVMQTSGEPAPVAFTRVSRADLVDAAPTALPTRSGTVQHTELATFDRVPDQVLVFDLPPALLALYAKGTVLGDVVRLRQGMATTDNARFVRRLHEVPADEVDRHFSREKGRREGRNPRWVPYNKGGSAVRWWGNQEHVLLWEDDAAALREVRSAATVEDRDFFRPSISWSNIGRNGVQFRAYPPGFVFDVAGMSAFEDDEATRLNLMGYLNSPLVRAGMDVLAPTMNYQVGDVARLPAPDLTTADDHTRVAELVELTRQVWATDPTSWEYVGHPVAVRPETTPLARAQAHVAERDALLHRIRTLEGESAHYWADLVAELTGVEVTHRDPGPLTLAPTSTVEELLASARGASATVAPATVFSPTNPG